MTQTTADDGPVLGVPKRFFQELITELEKPGRFRRVIYRPPRNCINIYRTPYSGARYGLTFGRGAQVRAEVFIDSGEQGKNKRLFNALVKDRQAVEAVFGESLRWEPLERGKGSRIAIYRTGSIQDDDETLQEIKTWAIDRLVKFKKVFDPRLARFRSLG